MMELGEIRKTSSKQLRDEGGTLTKVFLQIKGEVSPYSRPAMATTVNGIEQSLVKKLLKVPSH